jgi:hypothetical protein
MKKIKMLMLFFCAVTFVMTTILFYDRYFAEHQC